MDYYLGTDLKLTEDGDLAIKDGDLDIVSDIDCVKANLKDRIFADKSELILHPEFGAGLLAKVSLPLTPDNISSIVNELKHELLAEPRVSAVLNMSEQTTDRFLFITAKIRTIDNQIVDNLIFPFEIEAL